MSRYLGIPSRMEADRRFRALVTAGVLEPKREQRAPSSAMTSSRPDAVWPACVHESAHAVAALVAGDSVKRLSVTDTGGGLCERVQAPHPSGLTPWSPRMIATFGIDLIGAIAGQRLVGDRAELRTMADFKKVRARGDFENFLARAQFLTGDDPHKVEALRVLAARWAQDVLSRFWDCVIEVAADLRDAGVLETREILAAVGRTASGRALLSLLPLVERSACDDQVWSRRGKLIGHIEQRGGRFHAIDVIGKSRGSYATYIDATRALPGY